MNEAFDKSAFQNDAFQAGEEEQTSSGGFGISIGISLKD